MQFVGRTCTRTHFESDRDVRVKSSQLWTRKFIAYRWYATYGQFPWCINAHPVSHIIIIGFTYAHKNQPYTDFMCNVFVGAFYPVNAVNVSLLQNDWDSQLQPLCINGCYLKWNNFSSAIAQWKSQLLVYGTIDPTIGTYCFRVWFIIMYWGGKVVVTSSLFSLPDWICHLIPVATEKMGHALFGISRARTDHNDSKANSTDLENGLLTRKWRANKNHFEKKEKKKHAAYLLCVRVEACAQKKHASRQTAGGRMQLLIRIGT